MCFPFDPPRQVFCFGTNIEDMSEGIIMRRQAIDHYSPQISKDRYASWTYICHAPYYERRGSIVITCTCTFRAFFALILIEVHITHWTKEKRFNVSNLRIACAEYIHKVIYKQCIPKNCYATIGKVGNASHMNLI